MPPHDFFDQLNQLLSTQARSIQNHQGSVIKYTGDGVMAIFRGMGRSYLALRCGLEFAALSHNAKFPFGMGVAQALVYQCACPAQVCRAIFELRELYDYQINCANDSVNDALVHQTIAAATERAHEEMEACLKKILEIEGWDLSTFAMPEGHKKKPGKPL